MWFIDVMPQAREMIDRETIGKKRAIPPVFSIVTWNSWDCTQMQMHTDTAMQ